MQVPATLAILVLFLSGRATAESLREAAGGRGLGCAMASVDLQNPQLVALIRREFQTITPEYELMPEKLVDDNGNFHFESADKVVAFANVNHQPALGHMLVWHFFTRKWLFEDRDGKPLPRDQGLGNLKKYIDAVVGHYRGRIKAWDVVNEGLSDEDGGYLRETPALRSIGQDYIIKAFEFAHAADSDAELYYNDYNIEQPGKLERALRLIKELQSAGVRFDAIGVQGHWLLEGPSVEVIGKGIDALAATGVKIMITEMDIDPLPRSGTGADMKISESGENPYPQALPSALQEALVSRYGGIVEMLGKRPAITFIGFWGTHDGRSWLNDYPVKGRTNHPLLFDRKLLPKPAYFAVLKALRTK